MFYSNQDGGTHLSHDRPCPHCGHALHTFLACSDTCDCQPVEPRRSAFASR